MKIFTQSRKRVIDITNRDLFISMQGEVVAKKDNEYVLGVYDTEKAEEVLREIFRSIRTKKPCYSMPEE